MNIRTRRLSELKAASYNPRVSLKAGDPEYDNIKDSILSFGYVQPIIVNADDTILSGHQRRTVMLDMGMEEAEVVHVDLPEDQAAALVLAMNKISGKWDDEKLYAVLSDLDDDLFDLTGFTELEFEKLELRFDTDLPDDLDLERENEQKPQDLPTFKFGPYKLKLSEEEFKDLEGLYKDYLDTFRIDYGFVNWLIRERGTE